MVRSFASAWRASATCLYDISGDMHGTGLLNLLNVPFAHNQRDAEIARKRMRRRENKQWRSDLRKKVGFRSELLGNNSTTDAKPAFDDYGKQSREIAAACGGMDAKQGGNPTKRRRRTCAFRPTRRAPGPLRRWYRAVRSCWSSIKHSPILSGKELAARNRARPRSSTMGVG